LLEASNRADAGASWRLAGLGDGVASDLRRGSSEFRHGERLISRENRLAVGHHVAEASGFDFFQIISPDPAECCVRMVVLFGGRMIHRMGPWGDRQVAHGIS
jgi:hypothetical protein